MAPAIHSWQALSITSINTYILLLSHYPALVLQYEYFICGCHPSLASLASLASDMFSFPHSTSTAILAHSTPITELLPILATERASGIIGPILDPEAMQCLTFSCLSCSIAIPRHRPWLYLGRFITDKIPKVIVVGGGSVASY